MIDPDDWMFMPDRRRRKNGRKYTLSEDTQFFIFKMDELDLCWRIYMIRGYAPHVRLLEDSSGSFFFIYAETIEDVKGQIKKLYIDKIISESGAGNPEKQNQL